VSDVLGGSVAEYLEQLAAGSAVPGGGSAAALAGGLGVALVSMVARISLRKAADGPEGVILRDLLPELDRLRAAFGRLSQQDIDAYRGVIEARKRGAPESEIASAYQRAAEVPLETARAADEALSLFPPVRARAWEMTRSDLDAGGALLEVALRVALANVAVNLPDLTPETRRNLESQYSELASRHPA
jgi:glutamate formiminotransferase/formiminotetrahydrofolate cyclodeaminase